MPGWLLLLFHALDPHAVHTPPAVRAAAAPLEHYPCDTGWVGRARARTGADAAGAEQRIRERRRRFENMTPDQRRRLLEKREKWQNLSPEKKRQLREKYRQHRRQNADTPHQFNQNVRPRRGTRP